MTPTFNFVLLPRNVRVIAQDRDALTNEQSAKVWEIWEDELARRHGNLFDGTLLEFVSLSGPEGVAGASECLSPGHAFADEIVGKFVNYREYIASKRDPGLLDREIVPLSVSGITWFGDCVGLGRRAKSINSYRGWLELFPSGSIEESFLAPSGAIDYHGQLLKELREETGIAPDRVTYQRALALVYDPKEKVYDICVEIVTDLSKDDFPQDSMTDEYAELKFIPRRQLPQFLQDHGDELIPTSVAILETFDYPSGDDSTRFQAIAS